MMNIDKDNIFYKSAISVGKLLVLFVLIYLFLKLLLAENAMELGVGLFVLVFITLPTIFAMFFKKKFLEKHMGFAKFWKVFRVFYAIIVVLYIILWGVGIWHLSQVDRTDRTIELINSKKITLDDVMGTKLPPAPDQQLNESTIAGIDANNNYIRDDVELAIFAKYPDSAKIRAAELQYAQALQLELTQVYSSETLKPVMQKESLAYQCLGGAVIDKSVPIEKVSAILDEKNNEITNLVINTDLRKKQHSDIYEKYMIGYASLDEDECNIDPSSLPN